MIKVVCYTYLAATIIFLNVIERKYKRQIFPPDPIILESDTLSPGAEVGEAALAAVPGLHPGALQPVVGASRPGGSRQHRGSEDGGGG